MAQLLYDAYPEAIWTRDQNGKTPIHLARRQAKKRKNGSNSATLVNFLTAQLLHVEKAKTSNLDENGWLPLHHALKENAPLGTIQLMVRTDLLAILTPDNELAFPLHIACEFSTVKVVQFLVKKDNSSVYCIDKNKDSILHYACRGGNCG